MFDLGELLVELRRWDDPRIVRVLDPPVLVRVDLSRCVIPLPDDKMIGRVPLHVQRHGINMVSHRTTGMLHCWLRSQHGSWAGLVLVRLVVGNGERSIDVPDLVGSRYLTLLDADAERIISDRNGG